MPEREPYPSEKQDRFIVRLPDGMRDRIRTAAEASNRSMNAEIVATLEKAYPAPVEFNDDQFRYLIEIIAPLMQSDDVKDRAALRYVGNSLVQPTEKKDILQLIAYLWDHQKRPKD